MELGADEDFGDRPKKKQFFGLSGLDRCDGGRLGGWSTESFISKYHFQLQKNMSDLSTAITKKSLQDFSTLLKEIKTQIQQAQARTVLSVNSELIRLYRAVEFEGIFREKFR